ncbi:MAG: Tetrahydromethanopterin S-methyltransferase subunit B [Methanoregula sp. SKADARSKE-2]|jgi:tetrahydromethanopterin S-methyltransferase subunit B|nr:MAG: Tetrahydromethanopterin S-methyltransferase subunit B [Methanoregula sp. SKADARSKE-2]
MAYIQVLPEFGLVADPMVGLVTSAGESLSPVLEKVAILEATSGDLINMLSGTGNLLASFPNRDKGLAIGGAITSYWYGLAVGLFIAGIIAFKMMTGGQ